MIQFVSVMILQIFLPCYYGNQITFHAYQLTNEVYNTNWLQCSTSTRRLLNTYMEHLKRPVKIRAGYFFDLGLPVFVKVRLHCDFPYTKYLLFLFLYYLQTINNAYSFFAVLLNMSK